MPQQTIFTGWDLTDLTIRLHLNARKPGGVLSVELVDETGKMAGMRKIQWQKDRDIAGIPTVLAEVGAAWLWAPHLEAVEQVKHSFAKHCPEVSLATR